MKKVLGIIGIVVLLSFTGFCGKSKEEKRAEKTAKELKSQMEKVAQGMKKAAEQAQKGEKAKVMDFKVLKEVLPELKAWKRSKLQGQRMAVSGLTYSAASAVYTKDDLKVHLSITDTAGAKVALMPILGMVNMGIESENEHGYQKIVKRNGMMGVEEYDKENSQGTISMVYRNRYIITVQGENLKDASDMKLLWDMLSAVDFSRLD